jgi:hypothetical protein
MQAAVIPSALQVSITAIGRKLLSSQTVIKQRVQRSKAWSRLLTRVKVKLLVALRATPALGVARTQSHPLAGRTTKGADKFRRRAPLLKL